ncbi:MAG: ATP-binding cassette domain-containing protein, partial [Rhodobacterales bacterium]
MPMTPSDEILLSIEGLTVSYGAVEAVRGIDLTVRRGEIVTLLGANGAGKSSTLNALVGLAPRKARRMQFEGNDLLGLPPETIVRRGMTLVPEGRRVFSSLTVDENLMLGGAKHAGRGNPAAVKADMLGLFPILAERLHQKAGSLSG